MPKITGPPQRFDEELKKPEFEDIQSVRRARSGCGLVIGLVLLIAGVLWFLLKGLPEIRRRQRALFQDTWQAPEPTPFVRGIDYDVQDDDE
ncbi:MAG: hypothetical protein ABIK43_04390 [candidate division WOR-3 bacterium]